MTDDRPFDVVLLDLDGTVWDSIDGITRSLAHTLESLGLDVPDDEALARNVGPPLAVMLAEFGVEPSRIDEGVRIYRERYRRLGEFECEVYPGMIEVLEALRERGIRLATATSKSVEPTLRMLDHFEVRQYFEVVAAAPMLGHHSKQTVIAEALAGMADPAPSTVAMVGDRHYDIAGGRALGVTTVGVAWGYGGAPELAAAGADHVVDRPDQLGPLLGFRTTPTRR